MSGERDRIATKAATIERHLARVARLLPASADAFRPMTEASDGVVLHLWQAVQAAIDLAVQACARRGLGPAQDYAGAFRALAEAGVIDDALAVRLGRSVGFRNAVAHGYDRLDLVRVWEAARSGPDDLRALVAALAATAST